MDTAKINDIDKRLKKLENIFYGISDDPRVKEVIRKNVIVEVTDTGSPVIMDKSGTKYTLVTGGQTVNFGAGSILTISAGSIAPNESYHQVETEGLAASDDLDTIDYTNLERGTVLSIRPDSSSRTVVAKDGTGNLRLAGDFTMDNANDTLTLILVGSAWYELSRSDNAA